MASSLNHIVCILALVSLTLAKTWTYPEDADRARYLFRAWKAEHGKTYPSIPVESYKFEVFLNNLKRINRLNVLHKGSPEFALNHLADISTAEFKSTILMPKRVAPQFERER
ncbi:cysteine protease XCP1-like [Mizuhopecten yessoensis]|uniref:Xylem cysteine proteinase 1 n=1 Tax=Mizuhopecten yessoensis TaxID=6573 RepID=A0A210PJP1_MIZYE|nr:cysteine protease XCP1-like [Mizuhopecten yessoensis]OWF36646.1 Xylem cysteine proteinase 1 [Mizuhopecten yessoensis]